LKVAVTVALAFTVSTHLPVPVQAPVHFASTEPDLGAGVMVIDVPLANLALHAVAQLIPEGLLVTVPAPAPALFKVTVNVDAWAVRADAQRQRMHKRPKHGRLAKRKS